MLISCNDDYGYFKTIFLLKIKISKNGITQNTNIINTFNL